MKSTFSIRLLAAACLLSGAPGLIRAADVPGTAKDPLAPLAKFVGGQWVIQGRWANGEELRARSTYEWGIAKKIIVAKTFVMNGDKEYQRYEGIMAWHPKKKHLVQYSFAYNGDLNENVMDGTEKDTVRVGWEPFTEGQSNPVRQTLRFQDDDTFLWIVEIRNGSKWAKIMEGTWHRERR